MQKRKYGNTGEELSIIGFGGIIVTNEEQKDADNYVAEAIDTGINYFDVAPSYGNAEEKLGPALVGKRNGIFLACKTEKRTGGEAEAALNRSLKNLKTDYFDLYQLHAMTTMEDVNTVFGPGGAMDIIVKAQKEGKIRYIGFSAHSEEAALALMDSFSFTSILFPINWAAMLKNSFGEKVIEKASEKGVARLALKAMARTNWPQALPEEQRKYRKCWYQPIDNEALADLALRYTLSQPVTAAIPPGDIGLLRLALKIAGNYTPISEGEVERLRLYDEELRPIFPQ